MRIQEIATPVVVAGHVIDVRFASDWTTRESLELRKLDDLSLLASTGLPEEFSTVGVPYVTAAEHAPRVLLWISGKLVVHDFVPPTPTGK